MGKPGARVVFVTILCGTIKINGVTTGLPSELFVLLTSSACAHGGINLWLLWPEAIINELDSIVSVTDLRINHEWWFNLKT